ncbi:MAG TPA: hypothetical protein VKA85_08310 [Candidatus Limnocylindrales bacterium]|nr:hypothetical protein [Candidatus Limnocylindrales bacterium]
MPRTTVTQAATQLATAARDAAATSGGGNGASTPSTDAAAARRRTRAPGIQLDCGAGADVRHVGIAFVHGIGSQQPAETLLDWGGAVIRLLLDNRVGHDASADPVIACELDPGADESRYIELQLPATTVDGEPVPEQHWVMTEAWWAQRVRPPAFGQMAEWLGPRGAIRRILLAILPRPRGVHDPRLRPWAATYPLRRGDNGVEEAAERFPVAGHENDAVDYPDDVPWAQATTALKRQRIQRRAGTSLEGIAKVSAALYLQAISALILVIYGALRSIEKLVPIGPLKDGALTRPIDEFVLNWFGDVYVLLGDPAQAASVRGRLVDALNDLHAVKCDSVVVVAHSGGAIVSYMTLADRANDALRVDRLITLGEGMNLAWLLSGGDDGTPTRDARKRYERLYTNMLARRPGLRWDDFWASQDPAPVGVLRFPQLDDDTEADASMLARVRSHAIWNRLSFGEDHGGYWDNDEEFVLPMLRLLDERTSGGAFGDAGDDHVRSGRRRRRLSALSLMRQLALVGPTSAVVVAFAVGSHFVARASDAVAAAWNAIPGSAIVSDALDGARAFGIASTSGGRLLAETGVWVVAALIGLVTIFALIAPPERPVPWAVTTRPWVGRLLRYLPWLIATPVVVAVVVGGLRFISGATLAGVEVARVVVAAAVVVFVLGVAVWSVLGSPTEPDDSKPRSLVRDGVELGLTMVVMILASFLVVSPIVGIIAFEDVGRTALGTIAVIALFQVLGRVGQWRWSVWDGRERMAARSGRRYPGLNRVIGQTALLLATLVTLFLAVVLDSDRLLALGVTGIALAVLLGVSVDVFDASRREPTTPSDTFVQFAKAARTD